MLGNDPSRGSLAVAGDLRFQPARTFIPLGGREGGAGVDN